MDEKDYLEEVPTQDYTLHYVQENLGTQPDEKEYIEKEEYKESQEGGKLPKDQAAKKQERNKKCEWGDPRRDKGR